MFFSQDPKPAVLPAWSADGFGHVSIGALNSLRGVNHALVLSVKYLFLVIPREEAPEVAVQRMMLLQVLWHQHSEQVAHLQGHSLEICEGYKPWVQKQSSRICKGNAAQYQPIQYTIGVHVFEQLWVDSETW